VQNREGTLLTRKGENIIHDNYDDDDDNNNNNNNNNYYYYCHHHYLLSLLTVQIKCTGHLHLLLRTKPIN
jgi:hypothetical protein